MKKITRQKLIQELKRCGEMYDTEKAHSEADDALLAYIGDPEILKLYVAITKWYA